MSIFDYIKRVLGVGQEPIQAPPHDPIPATSDDDAHDDLQAAKSSNLDGLRIDKFAPLTTDEAFEQAKGPEWGTASLDTRDTIPSAELTRVRIIDQTMVGLGLISSEELEQIHAIGAEFDQYRTDDQVISLAAETAVQRSRSERERIKQEKKKEAAERREARKAEIAHRKANDIFFLGRGVSRGLANRKSDEALLQLNQLPVLSTPLDLARALGVRVPQLRWLAFHSEAAERVHYFSFEIPKKSGGTRKLSSPHKKLAQVQNWILENILRQVAPHHAAHGFVTGNSIVTNAQPHVGADVVINVDLKEFFPSITFWRVEGWFRSLGYSPAVSTILALLCTECPRDTVKLNGQIYHVAIGPRSLPQGACTSPAISNLICRQLDARFVSLAEKLGWKYTRYADDITWSSQSESQEKMNSMIGYILARIRHIADDEGFQVNEKKTRVLRSHQRQTVTGIVVNEQLSVNRKLIRQLRAILHNAKTSGLESQNRESHPDFAAYLNGMISFVEMVNADQGEKLRKSFNELSR